MFQIDQVTAVNRILKPLSGTRITDLDGAQNDEVLNAITSLDETVQKIQINNIWNFNSIGPLDLTADVDNVINTPDSYIFIRPCNWSQGITPTVNLDDLSVINNSLYNKRYDTINIGGVVTLKATRLFSYQELPVAIQNFAIELAKYIYVGGSQSSGVRMVTTKQDASDAFNAAVKWDAMLRNSRLDGSPSQRDVIRSANAGRWWEGY